MTKRERLARVLCDIIGKHVNPPAEESCAGPDCICWADTMEDTDIILRELRELDEEMLEAVCKRRLPFRTPFPPTDPETYDRRWRRSVKFTAKADWQAVIDSILQEETDKYRHLKNPDMRKPRDWPKLDDSGDQSGT